MKHFKLGFKDKPVPEQIAICKRTIAGFKTQRAKVAGFRDDLVKISALETLLAETEAALKRIAEGQLIVREGLAARKILLPRLLKAVTYSAQGYLCAGDGSEAWLRSAALEVHAPRTRRVGQPAAPARMRGEPSEHENAVQLRWKRPVRRCAFIVHMTTDPDATKGWKPCDVPTFRESCVVKGLKSGALCWFRVAATNAHGQGPWSNPVAVRVK